MSAATLQLRAQHGEETQGLDVDVAEFVRAAADLLAVTFELLCNTGADGGIDGRRTSQADDDGGMNAPHVLGSRHKHPQGQKALQA